ncbi:uncharacterized protein NEMAJ01_1866 [Nematocida major]|uniref:uncharacterized protein n=1 Tax=Nematocida major TaxID=1912982 RepID=UPI0020076EA1|nr:uncharacterized protein NEMAJ01_1866 [Nematocida major]KAH9386970.1 hypothetical protein NEMAJ01_1866 [Nematocida major]
MFSHEAVLNLEEVADSALLQEICELESDESMPSDLEDDIYALVHFGSTKSHKPLSLKKLDPIETNRCFQSSTICYKCNRSGHISRDCPRKPSTCFICNQTGHVKTNCPENTCRICKKSGHRENDCWKSAGGGSQYKNRHYRAEDRPRREEPKEMPAVESAPEKRKNRGNPREERPSEGGKGRNPPKDDAFKKGKKKVPKNPESSQGHCKS